MNIKHTNWILIFMVVIASCTPQGKSDLSFKLSPEETLKTILSEEALISPDEVIQLIENNQSDYQLVDLRSQSQFVKGSLEGAINIPTQYLFEPDNLKKIADESFTTILFGDDQLEANGPWVLLRQLGYEHLKVMQGGFNYIQGAVDSDYTAEQARYDYPAIFNQSVEESELALKTKPKPKRIVPKKVIPLKKKVVEEEEEEEEGC
ncbi:MAG: rhodanese-like domain-containing protein [Saprospiraceae bacterium]|nr:rhodanese-like domain-containing protein [Bacteroidia bacterium]NNF22788.1 rhodanese-like domain-containing protein [Saprospiraceae bacterium]NNK90711.1 rhodanese-like domain-containing protein [Saprospiraceae bacterium]